jgi:hypothetical protein
VEYPDSAVQHSTLSFYRTPLYSSHTTTHEYPISFVWTHLFKFSPDLWATISIPPGVHIFSDIFFSVITEPVLLVLVRVVTMNLVGKLLIELTTLMR